MKTGIVTFHRADNYGAVLQCYALYSVLNKMDCDVEVLDYRNPSIENRYCVIPRICKNLAKWIWLLLKTCPYYSQRKKRHQRFERFREEIKMSSPYYEKDLKLNGADYRLIISGSDQVLNPNITDGFDDIYYLDFTGSFRKATYAASLGNINDPKLQSDEFIRRITNFDYVSVRENDAYAFLLSQHNISAEKSLDPTFLIDESQWRELVKNTSVDVPERYILLYFVQYNSELVKIAQTISKERKIPVVYFKPKIKLDCESVFCGDAGPMEFVKLILDADSIVTSSFHATAFSSIFKKKDIHIIAHSQTGSRVASIAEMFGFQDRIYTDFEKFIKVYKNQPDIEYRTDEYLSQRQASLDYLKLILTE